VLKASSQLPSNNRYELNCIFRSFFIFLPKIFCREPATTETFSWSGLWLFGVGGLLQGIAVDLGHLQHGLHGAFGPLRILVAQQLAKNRGDDLPGEAELVLQPAAAIRAAAGRQFFPKF